MLADPDPALPLRVEASTFSRNGEVTVRGAGESSVRGIGITRDRVLERAARPTASGLVVTCRILSDRLTRRTGGEPVVTRQPLDGMTATGRRDASGRWRFAPEGRRVPGDVEQLEFLDAFENRGWLPGRKVAVGDSWEFPAAFIRRSLENEIAHPEVVGLMKLREISRDEAGRRSAIIDCVIRGGGGAEGTAGTAADGKLSGTLIVDLEKPGAMRLQLTGQFTILTRRDGGSVRSELPITLMVKIEPREAPH